MHHFQSIRKHDARLTKGVLRLKTKSAKWADITEDDARSMLEARYGVDLVDYLVGTMEKGSPVEMPWGFLRAIYEQGAGT